MWPGSPRELHFNDFCAPGAAFHVARARYRPGGSIGPHGHDFAELFWIEAGRGTHGTRARNAEIGPGYVCLIGAGDAHAITAGRRDALTLANVAFPDAARAALAPLCGPDSPLPAALRLPGARVSPACVRRLSAYFAELSHAAPRELSLHRFLFQALAAIDADVAGARESGSAPPWLTDAVERLRTSEALLADGLGALSRLAERSPDHVNRTCRRYLGTNASGLVNRLRLEHAERLLRTTALDVTDIAFRSGFGNLSYFYRLFRERSGRSPRAFRALAQRPVVSDGNSR